MAELTVSFDSIIRYFESLPDPRHTRNRRHLLGDVIVIAVSGVIVGCDGPTSIARWAKEKEAWLRELLALPNGIPSGPAHIKFVVRQGLARGSRCSSRHVVVCL